MGRHGQWRFADPGAAPGMLAGLLADFCFGVAAPCYAWLCVGLSPPFSPTLSGCPSTLQNILPPYLLFFLLSFLSRILSSGSSSFLLPALFSSVSSPQHPLPYREFRGNPAGRPPPFCLLGTQLRILCCNQLGVTAECYGVCH